MRYVPDVDAFLSGDDPVLFARSIPQLLALRITERDAWNSDGFDPYRCNLVIEALSDAPIDDIREVFASVAEQVVIVGDVLGNVPPEALSPASCRRQHFTRRSASMQRASTRSSISSAN